MNDTKMSATRSVIRVQDITHVRYQVPDLDPMQQFLLDFGLHLAQRTPDRLYMRSATSSQPAHISQRGDANKPLGFGLKAQSAQDLEKLAAHLEARVEVRDEPGGGQVVRFKD